MLQRDIAYAMTTSCNGVCPFALSLTKSELILYDSRFQHRVTTDQVSLFPFGDSIMTFLPPADIPSDIVPLHSSVTDISPGLFPEIAHPSCIEIQLSLVRVGSGQGLGYCPHEKICSTL